MRAIILAVVALFFASCSKSIEPQKAEIYPVWYLDAPTNTASMLYGSACAKSRDESIKKALDDLSSRLLVSLKSETLISEKSQRDHREYTSREVEQSISSSTQLLDFSSYKVRETAQVGDEFCYLVEHSREGLASSLQSELDLITAKLGDAKASIIDPLSRVLALTKIQAELREFRARDIILEALLEKSSGYAKMQGDLNSLIVAEKNSIYFEVQKSESFAMPLIKDALSARGFSSTRSKHNYIITLESRLTKSRSYGIYVVDELLSLVVKDDAKHIIITKTLSLKGASSNSYEDAQMDIALKLKEDPQKLQALLF